MAEARFHYGPRLTTALAIVVFCSGAGILSIYLAVSGGHGIDLMGNRLGPDAAWWVFVTIAIVSFGLVGSALGTIWNRVKVPQFITLGDGWIELPNAKHPRESIRIALNDIESVHEFVLHDVCILTIQLEDDKVSINAKDLPSDDAFACVKQFLGLRARDA